MSNCSTSRLDTQHVREWPLSLTQAPMLSAESAFYTSLGRSPRYAATHKDKRAEGPTYSIFRTPLLWAIGLSAITIGCSRKIDVKVIQTPTAGLFFIERIYRGQGAIDNDHTGLYLHLERNGKSDKQLVLSGTYVELNRIIWSGPSEATLCMQPGGYTAEFHSQVTLSVKNTYQSIHFLLREDC